MPATTASVSTAQSFDERLAADEELAASISIENARDVWLRVIMPLCGIAVMYGALAYADLQ
jgi:hypothetical protein